jgi:hypothetical protein
MTTPAHAPIRCSHSLSRPGPLSCMLRRKKESRGKRKHRQGIAWSCRDHRASLCDSAPEAPWRKQRILHLARDLLLLGEGLPRFMTRRYPTLACAPRFPVSLIRGLDPAPCPPSAPLRHPVSPHLTARHVLSVIPTQSVKMVPRSMHRGPAAAAVCAAIAAMLLGTADAQVGRSDEVLPRRFQGSATRDSCAAWTGPQRIFAPAAAADTMTNLAPPHETQWRGATSCSDRAR